MLKCLWIVKGLLVCNSRGNKHEQLYGDFVAYALCAWHRVVSSVLQLVRDIGRVDALQLSTLAHFHGKLDALKVLIQEFGKEPKPTGDGVGVSAPFLQEDWLVAGRHKREDIVEEHDETMVGEQLEDEGLHAHDKSIGLKCPVDSVSRFRSWGLSGPKYFRQEFAYKPAEENHIDVAESMAVPCPQTCMERQSKAHVWANVPDQDHTGTHDMNMVDCGIDISECQACVANSALDLPRVSGCHLCTSGGPVVDCEDKPAESPATNKHGKSGCPRSSLDLVFTNVTLWNKAAFQWIVSHSFPIIAVSETHLSATDGQIAQGNLEKMGCHVFLEPAWPTGRGGLSGGLMTVTRKHKNARFVDHYNSEGHGWLAIAIRQRGFDLIVVNVYLKSGVGVTHHVNARVLSSLIAFVRQLSCLWIVGGDWNEDARDMQNTTIPDAMRGRVVAPDGPTISTGAVLDYTIVHRNLEAHVAVDVVWEVPWKPHAAIKVAVNKEVSEIPVPQLVQFPKFQNLPGPRLPWESFTTEIEPNLFGEGCEPTDLGTLRFANWAAQMESYLFSVYTDKSPKGRGWSLEVVQKPLASSRPDGVLWHGAAECFWERLHALTSVKIRHMQVHQYRQLPDMKAKVYVYWRGCNKELLESFLDELTCFIQGEDNTPNLANQCQQQLDLAKKAGRQHEERQYLTWMQKGLLGGLRPLFRAIKKAEAILVRPFRDKAAEERPECRKQFWGTLWGDQPGGCSIQFEALKQLARAQAETLKPITVKYLKSILKRTPDKAAGLDGISYGMLRALPDKALETLADLYTQAELTAVWPKQVTLNQIALLPKNSESERPIALTGVCYRLWCFARQQLVKDWVNELCPWAIWDKAVPGYSCLDVALGRLARSEVAREQKVFVVSLLLDLKNFYDLCTFEHLVKQGMDYKYPPLILQMALEVYRGDRYLVAEGMVSNKIVPTKGVLAGCLPLWAS